MKPAAGARVLVASKSLRSVVGQVLAALHAVPEEGWTVDRLTRAAGVSRSVLAERFASMVGQPPIGSLMAR